MDNMQIRKAQLEKLDAFVKTLYDETQVFSQYMNMKDLEVLYYHIHELIQEMLQCKNTDEFMAMIEDLHKAVAGILIIAVPAKAGEVMEDMKESYNDFKGEDFDEMLKNLQKTSVQKYGDKSKVKDSPENTDDEDFDMDDFEDEPDNDPDEAVKMVDLQDHVKKPKSKPAVNKKDNDPFGDVYKEFS